VLAKHLKKSWGGFEGRRGGKKGALLNFDLLFLLVTLLSEEQLGGFIFQSWSKCNSAVEYLRAMYT